MLYTDNLFYMLHYTHHPHIVRDDDDKALKSPIINEEGEAFLWILEAAQSKHNQSTDQFGKTNMDWGSCWKM